mmetsp:Transcript_4803/g.14284  ORF Transcript_4803/g.14284 Transcript_4803/m.14284 type:complete len:277 (-) Transcript_4803:157-987(-)
MSEPASSVTLGDGGSIVAAEDLAEVLRGKLQRPSDALISREQTLRLHYSKKLLDASDARSQRHSKAPFLDTISVRSDHHGREPETAAKPFGQLLIEPTIIPDLSHTGVQVSAVQNTAVNAGGRLFYPNGGKSAVMSAAIRAKIRGSKPTEKELRPTYYTKRLHPGASMKKRPPPIESFADKMRDYLEESRPVTAYTDDIQGGTSAQHTAPDVSELRDSLRRSMPRYRERPASPVLNELKETENIVREIKRTSERLALALRQRGGRGGGRRSDLFMT